MKKIILTVLLISLALITACEDTVDKQKAGGAYFGGTQGVTAVFEPFGVEENGVYSIFDTETIPIEVTLNNKGEYALKPGDVTIELIGPSFDFTAISSLSLQNKDNIDIISQLLPTGGEETVTFATDAKYTPEVNGAIDRKWFANLDYKYHTYVILPEVCLKEDLKDTRICTVEEAKTFFVSGAPITVKSVDESTAGKGIMALKIKISNVGGGKVTKLGDAFGVQDKIGYSIDDPAWECKQGGKVNEARLINGEAEIVCKLKTALTSGILATKQVKLTLDYTYRSIIQETVRIKESVK